MIALATDYLVFQMATGENVPFSADAISDELIGEGESNYDPELVGHAANAVFHYFKHELGQEVVSPAEFSGALEKVLNGFAIAARSGEAAAPAPPVREADLRHLACESGKGFELSFFPLLRNEVRRHLRLSPRVLRFRGLRGCVKQLAGARRWSRRCDSLEEQIILYLRECVTTHSHTGEISLIVE